MDYYFKKKYISKNVPPLTYHRARKLGWNERLIGKLYNLGDICQDWDGAIINMTGCHMYHRSLTNTLNLDSLLNKYNATITLSIYMYDFF